MACALPADLLLEIVARSDPCTLIRCAAVSRLLRREILTPCFIRRVTGRQHGIMPACLLAYILRIQYCSALQLPGFSLVNPATPAAASFFDNHLCPFMWRNTANLLADYEPVTSRGGLVLLHRRHGVNMYMWGDPRPDCLCVYDPMTGHRAFLSNPPDISEVWLLLKYVLLTPKDGIGCAFKLVVVDVDNYTRYRCKVRVQTATSTNAGGSSWGPVTYDGYVDLLSGTVQDHRRYTVLLRGTAIHLYWLNAHDDKIITFDSHTERLDTVKLPPTVSNESQRHLQTSPDGRLWLLVADGFVISIWLLELQQGRGWTREAMIDAKENLLSLYPDIPSDDLVIKFEEYVHGERSSVLMLRICYGHSDQVGKLAVLDLETKEMRRQGIVSSVLLELDLLSRIQDMKIFP